jgi:hypothetical protein
MMPENKKGETIMNNINLGKLIGTYTQQGKGRDSTLQRIVKAGVGTVVEWKVIRTGIAHSSVGKILKNEFRNPLD